MPKRLRILKTRGRRQAVCVFSRPLLTREVLNLLNLFMRRHSNRSSLLINAGNAVSEALLVHDGVREREGEIVTKLSMPAYIKMLQCHISAHCPSQSSFWFLSPCWYMCRKNINTPHETTSMQVKRHIKVHDETHQQAGGCNVHTCLVGRIGFKIFSLRRFWVSCRRGILHELASSKSVRAFFLFRACCFWQQMRLALMPCRLNHKWHRSVWIRCGVCSAPCAKTNRPNVTQPMLALSFVLYDTLWVLSRPKCVEIAQITHSPHRP